MKITTTTIIFLGVSCFQIGWTLLQLKKEIIGIRSGLVWIIIWVAIGFGSIFPSTVDIFMKFAMMENRMFFILILSVFVLFAIVFNTVSKVERNERNTAKIVQEIALIRYQLEEKAKFD